MCRYPLFSYIDDNVYLFPKPLGHPEDCDFKGELKAKINSLDLVYCCFKLFLPIRPFFCFHKIYISF